jgi:hypothetical protein
MSLHARAAIRLAALLVQRVAAGVKVAVLIAACALKSSAQAGFDLMWCLQAKGVRWQAVCVATASLLRLPSACPF